MRRWLCFLMVWPSFAVAQDVSSADVIPPDVQQVVVECIRETGDSLGCYDHPGVTAPARALAASIQSNIEIGGTALLTDFHETGTVDLAVVHFPSLANTNQRWLFVNGPEGPLSVDRLAPRPDAEFIPSARPILARYPTASASGRISVVSVRSISEGRQRFTVSDIVTNGCRACEPVARSQGYIDFVGGRYFSSTEIGWRPWGDETASSITARLRAADIHTLQDRLNTLGYDAGPVDGAAGPRTFDAFYSFLRDHCFPRSNRLTVGVVEVLSNTDPDFSQGDCAPTTAPAPTLPDSFARGSYSPEERFCSQPSRTFIPELESYGRVTFISDHRIGAAETSCLYQSIDFEGTTAVLDLQCMSPEGVFPVTRTLTAVTGNSYVEGGVTYRLCPDDDSTTDQVVSEDVSEQETVVSTQGSSGALPDSFLRGFYSSEPRFCPNGSEPRLPEEDTYGRVISVSDDGWGRGEMFCTFQNVELGGSLAALDLQCSAEGEATSFTQYLRDVTSESFSIDGRTYQLCRESETAAINIPLGQYALHPGQCRGISQTIPAWVWEAFGPRPLELTETTISWDHSFCNIDGVVQLGDTYRLNASCGYADNDTWAETIDLTPVGENQVLFFDFALTLCPDAETEVEETPPVTDGEIGSNSFVAPDGSRWVQVSSHASLEEARDFATEVEPDPRIFQSTNGFFAVTAMTLYDGESDPLPQLIENYGWPDDSIAVFGERFVEELPLSAPQAPSPVFGLPEIEISIPNIELSTAMSTLATCVGPECLPALDVLHQNIDGWQQTQINIEQSPDTSMGEKIYRVTLFSGAEILQFFLPQSQLELVLLPAIPVSRVVGGASHLRQIGVSADDAVRLARSDSATSSMLLSPSRGWQELTTSQVRFGVNRIQQGDDWEDAIEATGLFGDRLPPGFVAFDFFDRTTGIATSAKTLNTSSQTYQDTDAIRRTLSGYVQRALQFQQSNRSAYFLDARSIRSREIALAIPADASVSQNEAIRQAVLDAARRNVTITVYYVE